MHPIAVLTEKFERALVALYGPELSGVDPVLRRSDHADFQSNVALALKKRVPDPPREIATRLIAALDAADICERVEMSGPGFINLHLRAEFLAQCASAQLADARLGIPSAREPETVVIDYSSPNIAKELHVGHLRSTIIGDALARTLENVGHRVIRQNHLGDWGTPFGMLIEHLIDLGEGVADKGIDDLNEFYKQARAKFDQSTEFADRSRQRVVLLQGGDEPTLRLWKRLVDTSNRSFRVVYERLGITMRETDAAGESFFNDRLGPVVSELQQKGLAVESEGALCVFPPGFKGKEGAPVPLIVRKKDGGFGYASTDLAAIRYRLKELNATRLIYVVGAPQSQHFSMIFKAAELAGWLAPPARAQHIAFGSVLGEDNKMLRAREGDSVKLLDLVSEADERALLMVKEKSAERAAERGIEPLSPEEEAAVAHAIGVAAIKYADLSADRVKDYVFNWKKMLAAVGNTGPYLQYAHARTRSILQRGAAQGYSGGDIIVSAPEERALVLALLGLGGAVVDVTAALEPHKLCTYLYELASTFSTFFERCPVLKGDPPPQQRSSRLALVQLTAEVLERGLGLLGIEAPKRM